MVIIGLLAGFVGPRMFAQIGRSEVKVARAQIDALQKALDQYRLDVGRYPRTDLGLAALVSRPGDKARWAGPYLSKAVPRDPWSHDCQYRSPGEQGEFDLLSLGRDGQPGGEGEDQDITSWRALRCPPSSSPISTPRSSSSGAGWPLPMRLQPAAASVCRHTGCSRSSPHRKRWPHPSGASPQGSAFRCACSAANWRCCWTPASPCSKRWSRCARRKRRRASRPRWQTSPTPCVKACRCRPACAASLPPSPRSSSPTSKPASVRASSRPHCAARPSSCNGPRRCAASWSARSSTRRCCCWPAWR